jgi:hypothetical protein
VPAFAGTVGEEQGRVVYTRSTNLAPAASKAYFFLAAFFFVAFFLAAFFLVAIVVSMSG